LREAVRLPPGEDFFEWLAVNTVDFFIDLMQAELVAQTTWRCQEKTEMVGSWKAKIYDMHNVQVGGAQYTKIWSNGCGC